MEENLKKITNNDLLEVDLMKEEFESLNYKLPNFEILAQDFDIEKAYEKESSFLLREIRKAIIEKLSAYLQLFETFMNPTSPPMFIFNVLRCLTEQDKDLIKETYKKLSKYQLWSVKLDTIYNEEKEAEFINNAHNEWQELKKEIYALIERLEKGSENNNGVLNKGGYFN